MKLVPIIFNWWSFFTSSSVTQTHTDTYTHIHVWGETVDPRVNKAASGVVLSSSLHQISWWHGAQALISRGSSAPHCRATQAWLTGGPHKESRSDPQSHFTKSANKSALWLGLHTGSVVSLNPSHFLLSSPLGYTDLDKQDGVTVSLACNRNERKQIAATPD